MHRNPGGSSLLQIALLAGGAYFLFRIPASGGPSLFDQLTGGLGTTAAPVAGQLTVPLGTPVPTGYRVISTNPTTRQQVIAPAPPGTPSYVSSVYSTVGAVTGAVGAGATFLTVLQRLFTPSPASASPLPDSGLVTVLPTDVNPLATPQFDSAGNVQGYYLLNADGTTTSWNAVGQDPMITDPSSVAEVPWWDASTLPTIPTFTIGAAMDPIQPDPLTGDGLTLDLWATPDGFQF
jgi:hypothetical protein